jgi:hypothetical protein
VYMRLLDCICAIEVDGYFVNNACCTEANLCYCYIIDFSDFSSSQGPQPCCLGPSIGPLSPFITGTERKKERERVGKREQS